MKIRIFGQKFSFELYFTFFTTLVFLVLTIPEKLNLNFCEAFLNEKISLRNFCREIFVKSYPSSVTVAYLPTKSK